MPSMSPLSSLDYVSAHFNDLRILTLLLRLLTQKSWVSHGLIFVASGNVGFASVRDGPLENLWRVGGGGAKYKENIRGREN